MTPTSSKPMNRLRILLALPVLLLIACDEDGVGGTDTGELQLPGGFSIHEYADVPGARSLCFGDQGTLFAGTRQQGDVYAVRDLDGDRRGEDVTVIASGLRQPNGVAFRDGALYVAEISRVLRFDGIEDQIDDPGDPVVVRDDFPTDGHHGWKYIAFGPDGMLYVPVGAPCNICNPENPIYAALTRMNPDGSGREIFAHGIRNTVGFDWNPETGVLWFTDNGRDWLGDNLPPDELNRAPEPGLHFGYPFVHGADIEDPELFTEMPEGLEITQPVQELGPHVAALGMHFYRGDMFPAGYHNQIFIAEHGSWNRSEKIGYRVTLVRHENGVATSYEDFATGWLKEDESVSGRPVDVIEMDDGSLLVSDDYSGTIWRIAYGE
ncbi:MAG: Aldose sugar dehydrogenase YliI [Calditrichaeota bacterium]|nr:Aldose sugar dehydrogenase YliI [Calditrichota bacterium]